MKTACIRTVATAMAMGLCTGLHASVTEHQPPAPLPEFKTPEQLAKWRTETTAKTSAQEASRPLTLESSTPFYTGKPYLAESASYSFKYREYNPEMGRWTTVDPSGFPDGANNRLYGNRPTYGFDPTGLQWANNTGQGAAYIQMYNGDISNPSEIGKNVSNPNPNYSGQCATGAQYLTGTTVDGKLHDAPSTSNWVEGDGVSSNTQNGTMIAYGWNDQGKYPNNSSGNHTAIIQSQTSTTITVIEQYIDNDGPTGMHQTTYNKSQFDWHIVTTKTKYDTKVSTSCLE